MEESQRSNFYYQTEFEAKTSLRQRENLPPYKRNDAEEKYNNHRSIMDLKMCSQNT